MVRISAASEFPKTKFRLNFKSKCTYLVSHSRRRKVKNIRRRVREKGREGDRKKE